MARKDKWPSRWWFWAFPALANLYVLLFIITYLVAVPAGLRIPEPIGELVLMPASFVLHVLVRPIFGRWSWLPGVKQLLQGLAVCEVIAVVAGLVLYGAACLVYAIVPAGGAQGEGGVDGSE